MNRLVVAFALVIAASAQAQSWQRQPFQWRSELAARWEGTYGQYVVWLSAGATYEIRTSDLVAGDPVLYLLDASGSLVVWDDDSGGRLNSLIRLRPARSGYHRLRLRAFARGGSGICSLSARIMSPPIIRSSAGGVVAAQEGSPIRFSVWARETDGRPVPVYVEGHLPLGAVVYGPSPARFEWTPGFDRAGAYEVSFVARTTDGRASRLTVLIVVSDVNRAPALSIARAMPVTAIETEVVTFEVTASDPDGDPIGSIEAETLAPGMTFDGSRFRFVTGWGSAGEYVVAFRVSETAEGGAVGRLEVRVRIEDAPTRSLTVRLPGMAEDLTAIYFIADGVHHYTEDLVPRDGMGGPLDTRETIDIVMLPAGYATASDLASRFPLQARDWRESILAVAPFPSARIRFWSVYFVDLQDSQGRSVPLTSSHVWPVVRAAIPHGAVDFVLHCNGTRVYGGAAFPEYRSAATTTITSRTWGAHEFAHLMESRVRPNSGLTDEYGEPEIVPEAPPRSRSYRYVPPYTRRVALRLRTPVQGGSGRCTMRISPPPIEEAVSTPPDRVQVPPGTAGAAEWTDREYGWRAPATEPWFAQGQAYRLASRGEYNEVHVLLSGRVEYRIELVDVIPGPGPGSDRIDIHLIDRYTPQRHYRAANLAGAPPRFDGARWVGAPWDHLLGQPDPYLRGKVVGFYEAGQEGLYRPTNDGEPRCQMAAGGTALLCLVCRAAMDRTLAPDPDGTSEVRDDKGPRPRFEHSDVRPWTLIVREGEWITGHFVAETLDGGGRSSIGSAAATRLPPGSFFNPVSGGFSWRPAPGQTGVHTVELRAVTHDGRVGVGWFDITVVPTAR